MPTVFNLNEYRPTAHDMRLSMVGATVAIEESHARIAYRARFNGDASAYSHELAVARVKDGAVIALQGWDCAKSRPAIAHRAQVTVSPDADKAQQAAIILASNRDWFAYELLGDLWLADVLTFEELADSVVERFGGERTRSIVLIVVRHRGLLAAPVLDRLDTPAETWPVSVRVTDARVLVNERRDQCSGRSSSTRRKPR